MALSPKTKAFAFAGSLVLVSTILLGTAVASTGSVLRPFMTGEGYGEERPLARGNFVGLGIKVSEMVDGQLEPIEGAKVLVTRLGAGRNPESQVATKDTNAEGVAVFQLRPGAYKLVVNHGELVAAKDLRLHESKRVMLVWDSDGNPHWREKSHGDLERRGDTVGLLIRVGENQSGNRVPVEGAEIEVHRYKSRTETELVSKNTTGERGFAAFQVHNGAYLVKVKHGNVSGEKQIHVKGDTTVGVLIDGEKMHWRQANNDAHRYTDSPRPSRPRAGGR